MRRHYRVSNGPHRPPYSEKRLTHCPRCASDKIGVLPANNPGSDQEWFTCDSCDHMWSQRRNRREQGERPERQPPQPPERHGDEGVEN